MSEMLANIRTLSNYRGLLRIWTLRDIRIRYKQSLLGAAWAILQPLVLMIVFTFVFSIITRVDTGEIPYPIFSYTALLPWTFFATSINFGTMSLLTNMNLVTKVYFPREILPIAAVAASFIDFLIASLVYFGLIVFYGLPLQPTLLVIPIILSIQIVLTVGVVLFASAINVFYRDIRFVVPLLVQVWMFATPIIYPITLVPERLRPFYALNPMAGLIEAYRAVALHGTWPDWYDLGMAGLVSIGVFLLGYTYFKRVEWQFADII
jgi:lipopolysaccharide transport system permease protein